MKLYTVKKLNTKTDEAKNYGQMCEADMLLVTKGYKKENGFDNFYNRQGSNWIFIVEEVKR